MPSKSGALGIALRVVAVVTAAMKFPTHHLQVLSRVGRVVISTLVRGAGHRPARSAVVTAAMVFPTHHLPVLSRVGSRGTTQAV